MRCVKHLVRAALIAGVSVLASGSAISQGLLGQEQKLLDLTRGSWAYFRDYNGRQLIYFTHLEVYRCGIARVSYSLDSDALDKEWSLQPCDPKKPNQVTTDRPYISLALGTARMISVQLTYTDGKQSPVIRINSDNHLVQ